MKARLIILVSLIFGPCIYSQTDSTKNEYDDFKVFEFYDVGTSKSTKGGKTVYRVDGQIVNKEEYEKYNSGYKNLMDCRPCYMKHYNKNGILVSYVAQYTDCRIGVYKEFFKDGKPKVIGQYKENHTGNWSSLSSRGYCSRKQGKWEYYTYKGFLYKIEEYNDGVLISTKP